MDVKDKNNRENMGYKIWRKDSAGWSLAYDTVFETRESAEERIGSLNAQYAEKVKFGELKFYPYRDDIKLDKDGNVVDPFIQNQVRKKSHQPKRKPDQRRFNNGSKTENG